MKTLTEHQIRMLRLHSDLGLDPTVILEGGNTAKEVAVDGVRMPDWLFSENVEYQRVRKGYAARWVRS